jgi:uncharacterized LabA/DUF88 family protein
MKYAVLIDGGFVRRKLSTPTAPIGIASVTRFLNELSAHPALSMGTLHRIYWYDAPPLESSTQRPLRGGRVNFATTPQAQSSRALFSALETVPHMSVRRGDLVFRGWRVRQGKLLQQEVAVSISASDLVPDVQQKGVDMRIGLDIASLTMKRHAKTIVLVAGDSDFVPAMKFARREGAKLYLVTLGHTVRASMLEHSDLLLDLRGEQATEFPQQQTHAA